VLSLRKLCGFGRTPCFFALALTNSHCLAASVLALSIHLDLLAILLAHCDFRFSVGTSRIYKVGLKQISIEFSGNLPII
jgi:hypothetical protein